MVTYALYLETVETYTLWLRGYAPNAAGDSGYVGVNGDIKAVTGFAPGQWRWTSVTLAGTAATLPLDLTGVYTLGVWLHDASVACS